MLKLRWPLTFILCLFFLSAMSVVADDRGLFGQVGSQMGSVAPFGQQSVPQNAPFGQVSSQPGQAAPFGQQSGQSTNPFAQQSGQQANPFGQQSGQLSNPFGQQSGTSGMQSGLIGSRLGSVAPFTTQFLPQTGASWHSTLPFSGFGGSYGMSNFYSVGVIKQYTIESGSSSHLESTILQYPMWN